jgi:capsular polysaccharide transport system permease protein
MEIQFEAQAPRRATLLSQLRTQKRVIGALLLREVQLRYGREGLGAGWLVAEPLAFIFPVLTMWSFIRTRAENGVPVMELCWTGYLPLMLFRHMGGLMIRTLSNNAAILYHRVVTPFDMLLTKILMESAQNLLGLVFSFAVLYMLGIIAFPENLPMFLVGYLYMIWWCAAIGLFIAALSERSVWVEKIWLPVSYMYIAIGGCFYMAHWLPTRVRDVALLQPSLQAYEMIRAGMLGDRVPTYGDPGYAAAALAILTLLGLIFTRDVRKHIEIL